MQKISLKVNSFFTRKKAAANYKQLLNAFQGWFKVNTDTCAF